MNKNSQIFVNQLTKVLGGPLMALASFVGLDGAFESWARHGLNADKLKSKLSEAINKKISANELKIQEINDKIAELGISGMALTGDTANKVGQFKKKVKGILETAKKAKTSENVYDQLNLQKLDEAYDKAGKLNTEDQRAAEDTFYQLSNKYNV